MRLPRQEKDSPTLKMMIGFVTENQPSLRDARIDANITNLNEALRIRNETTIRAIQRTYTRLNDTDKRKFQERFAERLQILRALQPKDPKKPDSDETMNAGKLKDLEYLASLVGLEITQ